MKTSQGFTRLHLDCHTELGDLFIMEGLIRYLADVYQHVTFTTSAFETAETMFADLPRVLPIRHKAVYGSRVVNPGSGPAVRTLGLGYQNDACLEGGLRDASVGRYNFDPKSWDREFYRHAGVEFKLRWNNTVAPEVEKIQRLPADCFAEVLYHDRGEFRIDSRRRPADAVRIRPVDGYLSAYAWMLPILYAKEIHCIDSAFLNFIETLCGRGYLSGTRLVFHRYARPTPPPTMLAHWEVIDN